MLKRFDIGTWYRNEHWSLNKVYERIVEKLKILTIHLWWTIYVDVFRHRIRIVCMAYFEWKWIFKKYRIILLVKNLFLSPIPTLTTIYYVTETFYPLG